MILVLFTANQINSSQLHKPSFSCRLVREPSEVESGLGEEKT